MAQDDADILASLRFRTSEEGGRKSAPPRDVFRCIFTIHGRNFDCGLLLKGLPTFKLGDTISAQVVFLDPQTVRSVIKVGDEFTLREDRIIAEGRIEEILSNA